MRDKNVFAQSRALPRMSWSPQNLYNLWRRSSTSKSAEARFERTSQTMFQQRWISKRLVRAYHGDHIPEKTFKRWYLPATLPDVRPHKTAVGDDTMSLIKWAKRDDDADRIFHRRQSQDKIALAPVGSLMFTEVERRLDVFIFRCCFVHSVYEARRLVVHGNVKLNGTKHNNPNTRLAPGDMVSVDPSSMRLLRRPEKPMTSENNVEDTNEGYEAQKGEKSEETNSEDMSKEAETKHEVDLGAPGQSWTKNKSLTPFTLPEYAAPFIFIPAYIEPSFSTCSAIYLRHPTAQPGYSEIPTPYDADGEVVRLAWEWYAKRRPRIRSRSQRENMPEDNERKLAR